MKKLFITIVMSLVVIPIYANDLVLKFDSFCASADVLQNMLDKFEEKPMLTMKSRRIVKNEIIEVNAAMFVNSTTKSYTIVEKSGNDLYCVVQAGPNIEVHSDNNDSGI